MVSILLFMLSILTFKCKCENETISALPLQKHTPGFLFTIPKTLTSGHNETVCLSLHDASAPSKIMVDLKIKDNHHIISRNLDSEHTCFELPVPVLIYKDPQYAHIQIQIMLNGSIETAHNHDPILIYPNKEVIFIETDRGIYKPGDRVKIRVLILTQDLNSIKNYKIPSIKLKNPLDITVTVWSNVVTELGLVQLESQLSQETVEGKWTIEANGELKTFEVRKHILPRFKVTLNHPKIIYTGGTFVNFEICAKYFYGQNVKGSALIKISDSANNLKPLTRMKRMQDGCAEFTFSNEDLYLHNLRKSANESSAPYFSKQSPDKTKKLNVVGLVTETGTNQVEIEEGHCTFTFNIYELRFVSESTYFQPGLPYSGKLQLFNIQEKLKDEVFEICYTVAVKRSFNIQQTQPCSNFTLGPNNTIMFNILPLRNNVIQIYLSARSLNHTNIKYLGTNTVYRLHSPSGSYIKIEPSMENETKCKLSQQFSVYYTISDKLYANENITFYYMIKSRNRIHKLRKLTRTIHKHTPNYLRELENIIGIKTKHHKLNVNLDKFTLKFKLDNRIISKYRLLVYTVLPNGETVSATKEVNIEGCLSNKVETGWSENQYFPDETATLSIETGANSLCSITVVDKSTKYLSNSKTFNLQALLKPFLIENEPKASSRISCIHHTRKSAIPLTSFDLEIEDSTSDYELRRRKRYVHSFAEDLDAYNILSVYTMKSICVLRYEKDTELASVSVCYTRERKISSSNLRKSNVIKQIQYQRCMIELPRCTQKSAGTFRSPLECVPLFQIKYSMTKIRKYALKAFAKINFHFQQFGVNVITNLRIITKPCYDGPVLPEEYDNDLEAEVQFYTRQYDIQYEDKIIPLRSFFPETWLWELIPVSKDGKVEISRNTPHRLTSWIGSTLCVSPTLGVGISETSEVTTFLPFFINVLTPYSIKRGEILYLYVKVFNYLNHDLPVQVSLLNSEGLEFLDHPTGASRCVPEQEDTDFVYRIRGTKIGKLNITVIGELDSAYPGECGPEFIINKRDAVSKTILIEPEGFPAEVTESALLCTEDLNSQNVTWQLKLPPEAIVPGTEKTILYFNADLLGSTIENLEQLLKIPTGCGEQVMANLAPNLYILRYLNATNKLTTTIKQRAIRNIKIGYQRILKFIHKDGSFSAFGAEDPFGSMFLTAFVIRTLVQAKPYIYVDDSIINLGVHWILEHQLENGCFAAMYHVFQDMGGTSKENSTAGLTSYVLISLKDSNIEIPDSTINNAKFCIQAHNVPDKYTLAISTYALLLMKWEREAERPLERLIQELPQKFLNFKGVQYSSTSQIEIMGYTLMSLLQKNNEDTLTYAHSIVRWLSTRRNSHGGFKTTQDTVVALDALSKYALIVNKRTNIKIRILAINQDQVIEISEEDRLKTKRVNLIRTENTIKINTEGEGCVLAQAVLSYNLYHLAAGDSFKLDVDVTPVSTIDRCSIANINPCVAYSGPDLVSNMAVLEVSMPSGYQPDRTSLYQLTGQSNNNVKKFEELDDKVVIYFTKVTNERICTPFVISENSVVESRLNSTIKIYDYYEPENEVSKVYEISFCNLKDTAMPQIVPSENDNMTNRELDNIIKRDATSLNPTFVNMDVEMAMPEGIEGNKPAYMMPENTTQAP